MRGRAFLLSICAMVYVAFLFSTWQVVREAQADRDDALERAAEALQSAHALGAQVRDLEQRIHQLQDQQAKAVAAWYPNPSPKGVASRVYPRGTRLRLTRELSADVVVNDYGPKEYTHRDLDISREVAQKLHMVRDGVAELRVEVLP